MMEPSDSRRRLVSILQHAYSGERAAGLAYAGHWRSVAGAEERQQIRAIEDEEWRHRRLVGEMLAALGSAPDRWREIRAVVIGRVLGALCHVSPWFLPMYGAGRLESSNIVEYEDAARCAMGCDRQEFVDCLLTMAEVEWEHEAYFRARVTGHSWSRILRVWAAPAPKEQIREQALAAPPPSPLGGVSA